MSDSATRAGAIRADSHMAISGGNVTINGSTAHWNGGPGGAGLLSIDWDEGSPKKWHAVCHCFSVQDFH